jgi:hypothetical protein
MSEPTGQTGPTEPTGQTEPTRQTGPTGPGLGPRYVGRARPTPVPASPVSGPPPPYHPDVYGPPVDPWATGPDGTRVYPPFTDPPYRGPTGAFVLQAHRPQVLAWKGFPRLVAAVLSVLAVCAAGGVGVAIATRGPDAPGAAPAPPGLGDPVRDGRFEFVVDDVSCGHPKVGRGLLSIDANGQFCLVELQVTNIGTESQAFADSFQKALGPDDVEYGANTGAGLVANAGGASVWNIVNPGITVTGTIVYDIPAGATITGLRLHDSPFSGGVTVTVG